MKLTHLARLALCSSLAACGSSDAPASLRVYAGIGSEAAAPGSTGSLTVQLNSPTAPAIIGKLTASGAAFGATLTGLSPTAVYQTRVQSTGASGAALGASDLSSLLLAPGAQGLFAVAVRSSSPVGSPVVFSSVFASARSAAAQGRVGVQASVEAGTGPAISLLWTASSGSFDDPALPTTTWTAGATGTAKIAVTATDANGNTAVVSFSLAVSDSSTTPPADPPANFWPNVRKLTAPAQVSAGSPAQYSVSAVDVDGDPITYAWSANCPGSFTTRAAPDTQFVPQSPGICLVTILLDDGRGGTNSQTATLTVQ